MLPVVMLVPAVIEALPEPAVIVEAFTVVPAFSDILPDDTVTVPVTMLDAACIDRAPAPVACEFPIAIDPVEVEPDRAVN